MQDENRERQDIERRSIQTLMDVDERDRKKRGSCNRTKQFTSKSLLQSHSNNNTNSNNNVSSSNVKEEKNTKTTEKQRNALEQNNSNTNNSNNNTNSNNNNSSLPLSATELPKVTKSFRHLKRLPETQFTSTSSVLVDDVVDSHVDEK